MKHLNDAEIADALSSLPGWSRDGETIVKQFTCATFADAVAAFVRVAFDAEAADHHPDVTISHRRLRVSFSTHSEGALTQKDIDGARAAERTLGAVRRVPPFTTLETQRC
jgi:4a-hydroxytetrahydrobiopterin dehydratase